MLRACKKCRVERPIDQFPNVPRCVGGHGWEFTENPATINDLMAMWTSQKGRCAVTGIVMTWGKGQVLPTSISLDRIYHTGGYSAENLRLVCHAVNAFKGRMADDEMHEMARAIVSRLAPDMPAWPATSLSFGS